MVDTENREGNNRCDFREVNRQPGLEENQTYVGRQSQAFSNAKAGPERSMVSPCPQQGPMCSHQITQEGPPSGLRTSGFIPPHSPTTTPGSSPRRITLPGTSLLDILPASTPNLPKLFQSNSVFFKVRPKSQCCWTVFLTTPVRVQSPQSFSPAPLS